jgi:anti-anti-sigma factor
MEDFSKENVYDVTVINVNLTRATLKEAQELKKIIDEEITIQHKKLLVDISQCEFIDSTFLGAIVYEHKRMLEKGGSLNIVEPVALNENLFHMTRILEKLNLHKSREEAIESFGTPRTN